MPLIEFLLNNKHIKQGLPPGLPLLDVVRYRENLMGTKIGCREGDCGACTVLIGELKNGELRYRAMTSCLLAVSQVQGKHVVTIEGINGTGLNPIQQAMAEEGATQCGFCTPGFVMSLAGFCIGDNVPTQQDILAAIDGNICRCTGYKSIERAAAALNPILEKRKDEDSLSFAIREKFIPPYFNTIKERLKQIESQVQEVDPVSSPVFLSGGTDLYVQKHEWMEELESAELHPLPQENYIVEKNGNCELGPSVTVTDLRESTVFNKIIPGFKRYSKLVSSTPIRNMATVAGNFINASPIGDLTIFFLALDAIVEFTDAKHGTRREVRLKKLFKGYKELDKLPAEFVSKISFPILQPSSVFHFEKVSKRMHLDIASVNTAMLLDMNGLRIKAARISAGGIAPIPLYLEQASAFLEGKELNNSLLEEFLEIVDSTITPISDTRGSAGYKRLLLSKLLEAGFLHLFPLLEENHSVK